VIRLLLVVHVICAGAFIDDGAGSPGDLLHRPEAVAAAAFSVQLHDQQPKRKAKG
jgi:hypothetical protein